MTEAAGARWPAALSAGARRAFVSGWLPVALALAYAVPLKLSWSRWTDPLVDYGRQLYVPWRLLEGELLYRDVAYLFGPLAPLLNTLVFAAGGVSMSSLVIFNLALVGAFAVVLASLFRVLGDRVAGCVAALVFLLLFAFAQYVHQANFNFVTPYAHDLSYGVMLAVACIGLLVPRAGSAGMCRARSFMAGTCFGLVFTTKPEVFAALCCALVALVSSARPLPAGVPRFIAGSLLGPLAIWLLFLRDMGAVDAARAVCGALLQVTDVAASGSRYYAWVAGFDEAIPNLLRMVCGAAVVALACLAGRALDRVHAPGRPVAVLSAALLCGAVPMLVVALAGSTWIVQNGVRPLPLVVAGIAALLWNRHRNSGDQDERARLASWLAMSVLALALMAKILLFARFFHYGFALAMPAAVLVGALLTTRRFPWRVRDAPMRSFWTRALCGSIAGVVVLAHLQASLAHYALRTMPVAGSGDRAMLVYDAARDPRGAYLNAFVREVPGFVPDGATMLVLPFGTMLNFLTRHPAGVPYYALPQPEIGALGEERILQAYRAKPPDFVVLVEQHNVLFGTFGDPQYGASILRWIQQEYAPVVLLGAQPFTGAGFGIKVLRRRPPDQAAAR